MDSPPAPKPRPRRINFVLFTLVVFSAGVFAGAQFVRPSHPAAPEPTKPAVSARVYMARKPARSLLAPPSETPAETAEDFERFRKIQPELVRSRVILSRALRPPEVAQLPVVRAHADPVEWLSAALQIEFLGDEIMQIGLNGDDTEGLRRVVDAVVGAYLDLTAGREGTDRADRLRRLQEVSADLSESLARKRQALTELRRDVSDDPELVAQNLLDCRREIRRVRLALAAEDGPKEGGTADKLRKQLEVLLREEKTLFAQSKSLHALSSGPSSINIEIDVLVQILRQVTLQLHTLKKDQDAPPRVELWEAATVRNKGGSNREGGS